MSERKFRRVLFITANEQRFFSPIFPEAMSRVNDHNAHYRSLKEWTELLLRYFAPVSSLEGFKRACFEAGTVWRADRNHLNNSHVSKVEVFTFDLRKLLSVNRSEYPEFKELDLKNFITQANTISIMNMLWKEAVHSTYVDLTMVEMITELFPMEMVIHYMPESVKQNVIDYVEMSLDWNEKPYDVEWNLYKNLIKLR